MDQWMSLQISADHTFREANTTEDSLPSRLACDWRIATLGYDVEMQISAPLTPAQYAGDEARA